MTPTIQVQGRHVIADLAAIDPEILRDAARIMDALEAALRDAGFHIVNRMTHEFRDIGAGFTGIVILAQSHATVHTYPEHGYLAVDVFGCGPPDPHRVIEGLIAEFAPGHIRVREFVREPADAAESA